MPKPGEITRLLSELKKGDPEAPAKLMPLVYRELRQIAASRFKSERPGHTLQPTALIHETYLRLIKPGAGRWKNREHFFGVASIAMRQILVEHARARGARKRGGGLVRVDLDEALVYESGRSSQLLALDDALRRLAKLSARQSRIVELRFFGGLTVEETAKVLGLGITTIKGEWALAKAWLQIEMKDAE